MSPRSYAGRPGCWRVSGARGRLAAVISYIPFFSGTGSDRNPFA
jgi:hypothetical protein